MLAGMAHLESALDLPCGTGRLSHVFREVARRVILADSSQVMLEVAREDHPNLDANYLLTSAERIDLVPKQAYHNALLAGGR
jgi:ubiquinone/menaquinone biosynthesis C-methylase UbiE